MKILLYSVTGIALIVVLYFIALSISSRKQPELGLLNNELRACPTSPNCICSEQPDNAAYIEPLLYTTTAAAAWERIKQAIVETGGVITGEQDGYLHAYYRTPLMRYIDDVELRLDESKQQIHIRSASRAGHSDLGANRQRVGQIREVFLASGSS
ncbi:MAG: DUF1499 domain-containing protein [Gammaproteobacteria bacterium]|nr:DUF1499 domain-containing protein [Gammaproteobacteria bacterium]